MEPRPKRPCYDGTDVPGVTPSPVVHGRAIAFVPTPHSVARYPLVPRANPVPTPQRLIGGNLINYPRQQSPFPPLSFRVHAFSNFPTSLWPPGLSPNYSMPVIGDYYSTPEYPPLHTYTPSHPSSHGTRLFPIGSSSVISSADDVKPSAHFRRAFGPFGVSILGVYCVDCGILAGKVHGVSVGSSQSAIARHMKKHVGVYGNLDVGAFVAAVSDKSVATLPGRAEEMVAESVKSFVCACGQCFAQKGNWKEHCSVSTSCKFQASAVASTAARTWCGRLMTLAALQQTLEEARLPRLRQVDSKSFDSETAAFLGPLIRKHETVDTYLSMFRPLAAKGRLAELVMDLLDKWDTVTADSSGKFGRLVIVGEEWLDDLRSHVELVPANHRSRLMVFDGQDIGEVRNNFTFTLRHGTGVLFLELSRLLRFVSRCPSFQDLLINLDFTTVPKILRRLLLEESGNFQEHPMIVAYCLSRCFRRRAGRLEMLVAGDSSSIMSTVTHLMRAAICSVLYFSSEDADRIAGDLVASVNKSRSLNVLSQYVRRLREVQRAKPREGLQSTTPEGDLDIDGFVFPRTTWSQEIPLILVKLEALFDCIFLGDDWKTFTTDPIEVDSSWRFRSATMTDAGLVLYSNFENGALEQVAAFLGWAFHGHGAGSMRYQELANLPLEFAVFHAGTVRYTSRTLKQFRTLSTGRAPVDRMLPWEIARYYLLYLGVHRLRGKLPGKVLEIGEFTIRHAVAEVYKFRSLPTMLQIRQKVASLTNILFPEGTLRAEIAASDEVCEQSGHAPATGWSQYSTELVGGLELIHRRYHNGLGQTVPNPPVALSSVAGADSPIELLRQLYGGDAVFRSQSQQKLAVLSLDPTLDTHVFVGLPCGVGKSIVWLLPALSKMCKSIVILPYKFLVYFLEEASSGLLHPHGCTVGYLVGAENLRERIPTNLPDILFISLEAAATLLTTHAAYVRRWMKSEKIRFVVDEVHTIHDEVTFRPPYHELPILSSFGVPVFAMSASLVAPYRCRTMKRLGLADSDTSFIEIGIADCDFDYPTGFTIDMLIRKDPVATCITDIRQHLEDNVPGAVHVLCATKRAAEEIYNALLPLARTVIAYGDSKEDELRAAARGWAGGQADVFVTTTNALVGNEFSGCHFLYVVGLFHSLPCVRQAIGRVRRLQRKSDGWIKVVVPVVTRGQRKEREQDDRHIFEYLLYEKLVDGDFNNFRATMTGVGVFDWISQSTGCYMANLCRHFGEIPEGTCQVCNRCRSSPVHRLSVAQRVVQDNKAVTASNSRRILHRMSRCCLVCGIEDCDGLMCSNPVCFFCGAPSSDHFQSQCTAGVCKVLAGKACFSCFDVYSRDGFTRHNVGTCAVKKRLKRLVFDGWRATGHRSLLLFLLEFSGSADGFDRMLESLTACQPSLKYNTIAVTHAKEQFSKGDARARSGDGIDRTQVDLPLLPPDRFLANRDFRSEEVSFADDRKGARLHYNFLRDQWASNRRQRQFVYGAVYDNLIKGYHEIDGSEPTKLLVNMLDGTTSEILVGHCTHTRTTEAVSNLGSSLTSISGNCNRPGDLGDMFAFGIRDASSGVQYVTTTGREKLLLEASSQVANWAQKEMPELLSSIQAAEDTSLATQPDYIDKRLGRSTILSRNLGNASHYDVNDASLSLGVFVESMPGDASNWFFVFPNVSFQGSQGLVVRLRHGTVISWDGRKIRHCTTVTKMHPNNSTYGLWYGARCRAN